MKDPTEPWEAAYWSDEEFEQFLSEYLEEEQQLLDELQETLGRAGHYTRDAETARKVAQALTRKQ